MGRFRVELITSFEIDIDDEDITTEDEAIDEAYDSLPYYRATEFDWDVNHVEEVDDESN